MSLRDDDAEDLQYAVYKALLAACEKRRVHGDAPKGEDAVRLLRKAAFALEDIGCRHLAWPVRDLADDIEAAIRKARGE